MQANQPPNLEVDPRQQIDDDIVIDENGTTLGQRKYQRNYRKNDFLNQQILERERTLQRKGKLANGGRKSTKKKYSNRKKSHKNRKPRR